MKNKIMSGHTISIARVALSVAGIPYDLGSGLVGIASGNYAANEEGEYELTGVKTFPKDGATAVAVGDLVEWDNAGGDVVANTAGDFDLGKVIKAELAATTTVLVMVNGLPGPGPSYS